jgi:NTE family protein
MGNPVLYPLFYETKSRDVIIVHINPIERPGVPRLAHEIENRLNEITFNASLIKELRAIAFVQKLVSEGWLKPEHAAKLKNVLIHSVRADKAFLDLSIESKFSLDWAFLQDLYRRGNATGREWLRANRRHLGRRSSVDLHAQFL